jgi:hypothetical protein
MTRPSPILLRRTMALTIVAAATATGVVFAWQREYKSGIIWPEPPVVDPGGPDAPPSDAIVLFDGGDMSEWKDGDNWIVEDGVATSAKTGITSKREFGDAQIHLEFASPSEVKGEGQGRGNSGLYLMGRYEIQILDSHENETYFDGQAASVYKQSPPIVNASRPPGEWQTLDVIFQAPQFSEEGELVAPAYVTVLHNGLVVQNHFELQGGTSYIAAPKYESHPEKAPIHLQFHGNPVRFRNIWVRENVHPLVGLDPKKHIDDPNVPAVPRENLPEVPPAIPPEKDE